TRSPPSRTTGFGEDEISELASGFRAVSPGRMFAPRATASPAPQPVVPAGGLRVVVAANLFARTPPVAAHHHPHPTPLSAGLPPILRALRERACRSRRRSFVALVRAGESARAQRPGNPAPPLRNHRRFQCASWSW